MRCDAFVHVPQMSSQINTFESKIVRAQWELDDLKDEIQAAEEGREKELMRRQRRHGRT